MSGWKIVLAFCLLSFISLWSEPVNLVWQVDPEGYYERDWVRELLEGMEVNEIVDGKHEVFKNNSIIVTSMPGKALRRYCVALHKKGYNFGVVLLSDETYGAHKGFYRYCKFVLRNYWHKKFVQQDSYMANIRDFFRKNIFRSPFPNVKIKTFPLGYKKGFWDHSDGCEIKEASLRSYAWSFAGQITKSTRVAMISSMKNIPNHFIHEIFSFNGPDSLSVGEYRDLLLNTTFVPCPRGWWNLDSFRVCEALECGCIPIVEKQPFDYFEKSMGPYPFLAVNSWDEAPALLEELLKDPVRLEALRLACYEWWAQYKKTMKKDVTDLVQDSFFADTPRDGNINRVAKKVSAVI